MGQGHDEQSAYAICRTSLNLTSDDQDLEMSDEDMKKAVKKYIEPRMVDGWPTKRINIVVARPIGKFKNGPVEGELSAETIMKIVQNFSRTTKVPVYLWDHVQDLDETLPDGWVLGLSVNRDGLLIADTEVMGDAVSYVDRHQVRSASIAWNPSAKDYQGKSIGPLLMHVTLTNNPYIKDLPAIAARDMGGAGLLVCFTALTVEEVGMADPKDKKEPIQADKDRIDPTQDEPTIAQLKERDDEIVSLKAKLLNAEEAISEMKEKLDARPVDEEKEQQAIRLKHAEFKLDALEIRELVAKGLHTGTLKPSWCSGYSDNGYNGTMSWFKASRFQGDKKLLAWAVENSPVLYKVGRTFQSGAPTDGDAVVLTQEDRELIRKLKMNPEQVMAGMKSSSREEFVSLTEKEK